MTAIACYADAFTEGFAHARCGGALAPPERMGRLWRVSWLEGFVYALAAAYHLQQELL